MLDRQGIVMNQKKLRRLYREEKLQVRRRGGRKRALGTRRPMLVPDRANARWTEAAGRFAKDRWVRNGNHQARGQRQGLRGSAAPLGRGANLRMAGQMPKTGKGLRAIHRIRTGLGLHRKHPHAHPKARKGLKTRQSL